MSTFTKRVSATNDDGSKYIPDSSWASYMVRIGSSVKLAFRITSVTIPQYATINSAYIKFKSNEDNGNAFRLKVYGIDEDNTGSMSSDPTGRTKTTANIDWDLLSGIADETEYTSPDIKTIVQEIVDRSGWASNNAMGFIIEDDGSSDTAAFLYDYEENSTKAIELVVDYSSSSPSVSPSASISPSSSVSPSSTPSASVSPSSSVSPSASISPSSSASASPSPENYGLKIKRAGVNKDVQDITDPKEFAFTSALGVLGLKNLVTVSDTTNASGVISKTYTHNIGYPVFTIIKTTAYDGQEITINPTEWHSYYVKLPDRVDIEVTEKFNFKINDNTVVISVEAYESDNIQGGYFAYLASRSYTFKIYQYFNEITDQV